MRSSPRSLSASPNRMGVIASLPFAALFAAVIAALIAKERAKTSVALRAV